MSVERKEKIIDLYKTFLKKEEFPIISSLPGRADMKANTTYFGKWNTHSIFGPKHENQYLHGDDFDYTAGENIKKRIDYAFLPDGEALTRQSRQVVVLMYDYPDIVVNEFVNVVEKGDGEVFSAPYKLFPFIKKKFKFVEREYSIKRTLNFGSIHIEITEDEFNELYDFCKNESEGRNQKIDEKILDERIKMYKNETEE